MKSRIGLSFACAALGLAAMAADLPAGYVKVEYIESTKGGGQYIDTGYKPTVNTRIVADFNTMTRSGDWAAFFGLASGVSANKDGIILRYYEKSDELNAWFFNEDSNAVKTGDLANRRILVELKSKGLTVNGVNYPIDTTGTTPCNGSLYIFCANKSNSPWAHQAMRLYSFKIYEGDDPKRDFVPCIRISDNAPGLFDKVDGEFRANVGSGQFKTDELPAGYTKAAYIESTAGGGQYINTGHVPTRNTRIVADLHTMTRSSNWSGFFGAGTNNNSDDAVLLRYFRAENTLNARFCSDIGDKDLKTADYAGMRIAVELKAGSLTINGNVYSIGTKDVSPGAAYPIYLFTINFGNNSDGVAPNQEMRLYSFKIYEGNILKRDFVPCVRNADNVAGLYDKAEGKFYGNAGSGRFRALANLPSDYVKVDYIESTAGGKQYIDTGYKPNQDTHVVMDVTVCGTYETYFNVWDNTWKSGAFGIANDGWQGVYVGYGNEGGSATNNLSNGRHVVELDKNIAKVDGEPIREHGKQTFSLTNNLYLFACNNKGRAGREDEQESFPCHGCKIYEGEDLKRDFVPCVHISGDVAGLFDRVEGKFYGNAGSGQFRTIGDLPAGYVPLEYIESTNVGKQYIDTGYKPTVNTRIVADFNTMTRSGDWAAFFGLVSGVSANKDGIILRYYEKSDKLNAWFLNEDSNAVQTSDLERQRIAVELKSKGLTVNGVNYPINTTGTTPCNGSLYIFCANNSNGPWAHQAMQLYSFKIYEGDALKRDFVPCLQVSSGAAGLFDNVEDKFYAEAGGTCFAYPAVDIPSIEDLPRVGLPYIDRGEKDLERAELPDGGYTLLTSRTHDLEDGKWYAVSGDVTVRGGLVVHGKAHLILCDGAALTVTDVPACRAAIAVEAGDELTIYGQERMTGRMTVTGGTNAAGIGSCGDRQCGTIVINGGRVTASGGIGSVGIGSGRWGEPGCVDIHPACADRVTSIPGGPDLTLVDAAEFDGVLVVGGEVWSNKTANAVFKVAGAEQAVTLTTDAEGRFAAKIPGLSGSDTSVELVRIDGKDVSGNKIMRLPRVAYALVAATADTVVSDEELAVADGEITVSGDLIAGESIQVNGTVSVGATDAVSVSKAVPADAIDLYGVRIANGGKLRWIGPAEQVLDASVFAEYKYDANFKPENVTLWYACLTKGVSVPLAGDTISKYFVTSDGNGPRAKNFTMRVAASNNYPPANPATDEGKFNGVAPDNVFVAPADGLFRLRLHKDTAKYGSLGGVAMTLKVEEEDGSTRGILEPGWIQNPAGFYREHALEHAFAFIVRKGDKVHLRLLFSEKMSTEPCSEDLLGLDVQMFFHRFGTDGK